MGKEEIEKREKLYKEHKTRKLHRCENCRLNLLEPVKATERPDDKFNMVQEYKCKNCGAMSRLLLPKKES